MKARALIVVFALLVAACSGSSADDTTTTTAETTTSEAPTTTESTTTTVADTTTSEAATTTAPEDTTTTTEGDTTSTTLEGDTTTTTGGEGDTSTTTTSFPPTPTTSSTTLANVDPDLEPFAGVYRQPTAYPYFMELRADGVVRAGTAYDSMPFEGTWDHEAAGDVFVFMNFDIGGGDCGGADGRYARETARGGGTTLTLIEDPCDSRVAVFTLPGADCLCMTWLPVDDPSEADEE